jgi:serine/threonine protein kinase/tetratricopeptide (TPR) repeat protein
MLECALEPEPSQLTAPVEVGIPASARSVAKSRSEEETLGSMIGRYELLERIGEGGFGVVYVAEQREPIKRRVALKIIKLGMDTRQIVARFEAERQALAMMDHPNIAKVFDGGATETGRPYFVMELVRGMKITDYCDRNQLTTRERLDLFIQVCQAIQHAHQKGIIHRDIKPSNILVTLNDGVPVPKVIDFGIAKATQGELTEKTVYTRFQQLIGTPAFMSPEQAEMTSLDIDTRSDIYSLGVLLYELLTGKTPFDHTELVKAGLDEMRRMIREQEPLRPSTRFSSLQVEERTTTAKRRGMDSPKLVHQLRGDLDWIVMKCLEKDRTRRYETANGLARDVERFLGDEPVLASPPSRLYKLQKLVRRNKLVFVAVGGIGAALLAGLAVSSWLLFREKAARKRAVAAEAKATTQAARSDQIAQLLQGMLRGVGPSVAKGRNTEMLKEILGNTVQELGNQLTNQPVVEVEMRQTIGDVYQELGDYERASAMYRICLEIARKLPEPERPDVGPLLTRLALSSLAEKKFEEAEKSAKEALAIATEKLGPSHTDTLVCLNNLAMVLMDEGRLEDAEVLFRKILEFKRAPGAERSNLPAAINNLVDVLRTQGKINDEVENLQREALTEQRRTGGEKDTRVAGLMDNLGKILELRNKLEEAEKYQSDALALRRELFGNDHPDVVMSLINLSHVVIERKKEAEGEELLKEAISIGRRLGNNGRENLTTALRSLGNMLQLQNRWEETIGIYRECLQVRTNLLGPQHLEVAQDMQNLALSLLKVQKLTEAEANARGCLEIREKLLPDDWRTAYARMLVGRILSDETKFTEAEPFLIGAYQGFKEHEADIPPANKSLISGSINLLAKLYDKSDNPAKATEWRSKLPPPASSTNSPSPTSPANR